MNNIPIWLQGLVPTVIAIVAMVVFIVHMSDQSEYNRQALEKLDNHVIELHQELRAMDGRLIRIETVLNGD